MAWPGVRCVALSASVERGFVAGAGFGLVALAVQSCADFGSHIPAVGVTAVVLAALIARLGRTGGVKQPALAVTAPGQSWQVTSNVIVNSGIASCRPP